MVVATALETAGVGILLPFLTLVADPRAHESSRILQWLSDVSGAHSHAGLVTVFALCLAAFFLVKNLYMMVYTSTMYKVIFRSQAEVATRLLDAYMRQPQSYHVAGNSSEMMRNIIDNTRLVHNNILVALMMVAVETLVTVSLLAVLIYVDPVVSPAMCILLVGVGGLFYLSLRRRAQAAGAAQQTHAAGQIRWVQQALGALRELRVLGRTPYFSGRHREEAYELASAARFHAVATQAPRFVIETIGVVAVLLTPVAYVLRGDDPINSIPVLAVFAAAGVRLMPAITRLIAALTTIRHFGEAAAIVDNDLHAVESTARPLDGSVARLSMTERISLRGLEVAYEKSAPVLKGLDLDIARGEVVAVVGPSGAGKSTLMSVLLGLVDVQHGSVRVDGRALDETTMSQWTRCIGYIAQPTYLLDGTVRDNVALGIAPNEVDDARVWEVLEAARLDQFVRNLEGQLDARIGERGARFSGGQGQRIGIARALYHAPDVLLMDEATSALDNVTEREVTDAILAMGGSRTVILIAHRISSVKRCDRIVFLADGRVAADGSFEELLDRVPAFQRFVEGHP